MENEPKNGLKRYQQLQAKAKELGITASGNTEQLEAAIKAKETQMASGGVKPIEKPKQGLTAEEAAKIEASLELEFEIREKRRTEIQAEKERATIMVEAQVQGIAIKLPEKPTELQLAQARQQLNIKKMEVKPSPETVAIEKSKRGYYIFTNQEQHDAAHTVNLGGKYTIHLIPDQVHVLSEFHVKRWRSVAVTPIYGRVPVKLPSEPEAGRMGEECKRIGGRPRFLFEHLGEAPDDAPFGMVTDMEILDKVMPKPEELLV